MEQDVTKQVIDLIVKSNMSIAELSRKSGVSESAIKKWIRGRGMPTVKTACWMLSVLGYELQITEKSH